MATAKKSTKSKPAPEPEEIDEELEELEEDEVEEEPKGKKSAASDEVTFGVADLAKLISKKTGEEVTTRELRTLIRKMARDGSGRVNREVIPGNRSRYDWSGPNDPEVKAIIKAFTDGELEEDKKEKLAALKAKKDAERAAKKAEDDGSEKAPAKKTAAKKKAAPEPDEDEDEDLELDEDED